MINDAAAASSSAKPIYVARNGRPLRSGRPRKSITPGNPLHYATASLIDGRATGLLVTANEGRPTKIEGNPEHPSSRGAIGHLEQAEVLRLYDPQRLKVVLNRSQSRSWRAPRGSRGVSSGTGAGAG